VEINNAKEMKELVDFMDGNQQRQRNERTCGTADIPRLSQGRKFRVKAK